MKIKAVAGAAAVNQALPIRPGARPVVLFDSYHAHNFIHRGLVPDEHTYHQFVGLRRAAKLLEQRGCEVRELIVGPLTTKSLMDVQLVVLNLPSMDRPPWLVSEIDAIEQYIRGGGGMIFITDHSNCYYHQYHLLPLWDRLGLIPTFETVCEDTVSCRLAPTRPSWLLVRKFESHPVTVGVRYFGAQTGGRVSGAGIVAWSSDQAWADAGAVPLYGEGNPGLFGDMSYAESEERGEQGIILARTIDNGRVVVIADQNSMGDAFMSYADNWQLWLNACQWSGNWQWPIEKPAAQRASDSSVQADRLDPANSQQALTTFDQLVGMAADRNQSPSLLADSWQVDCWEPLKCGEFRWGGGESDQYYYFWCWMNRWTWVSAGEESARPPEFAQGRRMLLAVAADFTDSELKVRAEQTLRAGGKFILLGDDDEEALEESEPGLQWVVDVAASLVKLDLKASQPKWSKEPIGHWSAAVGDGTLIAIPNPKALSNGVFCPPEVVPGSTDSRWQRDFHRWLFDCP